jgi:hypothetical protein
MAKDEEKTEKDKVEDQPQTVIREIQKSAPNQGRVFQIENRHAKVTLTSNYENDEFPRMATIGVKLIDHLTGVKKLLEDDQKDHT